MLLILFLNYNFLFLILMSYHNHHILFNQEMEPKSTINTLYSTCIELNNLILLFYSENCDGIQFFDLENLTFIDVPKNLKNGYYNKR